MKTSLPILLFVLSFSGVMSTSALAQSNNGALTGKPTVHVDFYRLPPGRQDEWLALYKKWHYPIMKYQKEHGQVTSETVYTRVVHELSPSWDIAIVIISPPPEKMPKAEMSRQQLIRSLYPNLDEYVAAEKQRWALTLEHWDEQWVEVDIDKNPSLYYPAP